PASQRLAEKQRKKRLERVAADIEFYKTDRGKYVRELERKYNIPREITPPCSPCGEEDELEPSILDESIPKGLPPPLWPHSAALGSPYRRAFPMYKKYELHLEPTQFERIGPEGVPPLHPDLQELANWEEPFEVGDVTPLSAQSFNEEDLMYTPEPFHPTTPPSVGAGPCGTYSPQFSPPLGLLESPDFRLYDPQDIQFFDEGLSEQSEVRDFLDLSPPYTSEDARFDFFIETKLAKGREGIKPRPLFSGGYGEKPKKYFPRWYSKGPPSLRVISEEGDNRLTPPCRSQSTSRLQVPPSGRPQSRTPSPGRPSSRTPSRIPIRSPLPRTPSPRVPIPARSPEPVCTPCSPDQADFDLLERQFAKKEARRKSKMAPAEAQHRERTRRMKIQEMEEEADRRRMLSPGQREFEDMERQIEQESRPKKKRGRQQKDRDYREIQRRAMIDEMAEDAERQRLERTVTTISI
ncbi:hypothetical protein GWI33_009750, partial [Rhynchophorus ferrugineus]